MLYKGIYPSRSAKKMKNNCVIRTLFCSQSDLIRFTSMKLANPLTKGSFHKVLGHSIINAVFMWKTVELVAAGVLWKKNRKFSIIMVNKWQTMRQNTLFINFLNS